MNRRLRSFPLEDVLVALLPAGFLLAAGWSVMYEVYHEEGSYYSTLMQEILSSEGLFPYFLVSAIFMAFPLGLILDAVRHVLGEVWLGLPGTRRKRAPEPCREWLLAVAGDPLLAARYPLYRHARATTLTPARAAGNLAVVLAIFLVWFVVKIIRIEGWTIFSPAFLIGTPIVGVALVAVLLVRYVRGLRDFDEFARALLPAPEAGRPVASEPISSVAAA